MNKSIKLPCLRGRMGDWYYYVSLMNFKELASRASLVPEIHKNLELSRWIQREVSGRTEEIVNYLKEQPQRFFNAIICGIYDGKPSWQELDIENRADNLSEHEVTYLGKTFGILTLDGNEKIFAIDGQHRTSAIKQYISKWNDRNEEEVTVIFLAHKNTPEGEVRTRRLFSTLNRYAVPVNISEIIALDEEDNCAIITRRLMEDVEFFNGKIQYSKSRSMSKSNTKQFTNIILLYDIVTIILTDKTFLTRIKLPGYQLNNFTKRRTSDEILSSCLEHINSKFDKVFTNIPSLLKYNINKSIDRSSYSSSLLFRPIGQMILFWALKVGELYGMEDQVLDYFNKDDFNLSNPLWAKVFIDQETNTLKTDKPRQNMAILLICKKSGIPIEITQKEQILITKFDINID
jgi:DNA sulfur modification protein DndB